MYYHGILILVFQVSRYQLCSMTNYVVKLFFVNSTIARVNDSYICKNGACSTSFSLLPADQNYSVGISAMNMFGLSNLTIFDGIVCK